MKMSEVGVRGWGQFVVQRQDLLTAVRSHLPRYKVGRQRMEQGYH
jgi:hypothetical protein